MPFILAVIGIAVAAYVWYQRAQRAGDVASDLLGTAQDVKNAARRFGFNRRANQHPVDGIDDPRLAIGGLAQAFLALDDLPTSESRAKTDIALRKHLELDAETAQEISVLGRWMVEECNGPATAVPRLGKRLRSLDGIASFEPLMAVLRDVIAAGDGEPSTRQSEALEDLARIFRLR